MKQHKRPTKLEEAQWKIHLDIDGDKDKVMDQALTQVRQLVQLIIGQDEIDNHDVSMVVSVVIQERNKLRGEQREVADKLMGRDAGIGQRL